jgi:soluble lytic murein transglycosylase-like protein
MRLPHLWPAWLLLFALFFLPGSGPSYALDSFDPAVHASLGKMGLSAVDLLAWGDEIPGSVLSTFWAWPAKKQREGAVLALHIRNANPTLSARACWRMGSAFVVASMRFGVPLDLAVAVARAESGFNPAAKSNAGATGVMQVMPNLHRDLLALRFGAPERWSLVDPEKAILAGSFLLAGYLREEGTVQGALSRYLGTYDRTYQDRVSRFRAEAWEALSRH